MLSAASASGGGGRGSIKGRNHGSPARASEDSNPWAQWKQQLTAYVAWVNSQLKKKPGTHLVEDLRHDIRDGVALVDLVEIIGGEKLEGVHPAPSNYAEMRDNVDKVLQFMTMHHIKMHHITTRDIIEGNLKAIMRMILALAAHYKPNSVRHSSQTRQTITGIAQGAAAALTEARRYATKAGHRHRRRRQRDEHRGSHMISDSDLGQRPMYCQKCKTSLTVSSSCENFRGAQSLPSSKSSYLSQRSSGAAIRETIEGDDGGRAELEGASGSSSPVNSHSTSPRMSLYLSDPPSSMEGLLASGGALMSASCESDSLTDSGFIEVFDSLKDTHQMLLNLHDILLNGESSENNFASEYVEGSNSQEKMIILNERLLHAEETINILRADLNKTKKDCMELQATKVGLEQRLTEKENQLARAKASLMELELEKSNDSLETESMKTQLAEREQILIDVKTTFVKQAEEKDRKVADLRKEILKRDQSVEMLQEKLAYLDRSQGEGTSSGSTATPPKVDGGQGHQGSKGASVPRSGRLDLYVHQMSDSRSMHLAGLKAVRDGVVEAWATVPHQDSSGMAEAFNSLEENIVSLVEGLNISSNSPVDTSFQNGRGGPKAHPTRTTNASQRDSQKVSLRGGQTRSRGRAKPITPARNAQAMSSRLMDVAPARATQAMSGRPTNVTPRHSRVSGAPSSASYGQSPSGRSHIPVPNGARGKNLNSSSVDSHTQVVYYLNSFEKPHGCNIQKRLGEITLGDFKLLIEDPDLYHFYFKVLDPEYGTVKEELSHDEDILPGWEGKIVAWLEEESGLV